VSDYQYPDPAARREAADRRFQLGRLAVKEGRLDEARELLLKAVEIDREHSDAWLWLSATTDDLEERRKYLEWALAANPGNPEARRGLAILRGQLNPKEVLPTGAEVAARRPAGPEEASPQRTFDCPNCGGSMHYDPHTTDLRCERCGHVQVVEEVPARAVEQSLDLTLPTEKGHRWAEAERRLTCQQCGATTIFPVGQTSGDCPFCDSNLLIAAREDASILTPQAVIPMAFQPDEVRNVLRKWLGTGVFAPDDLAKMARAGALQPAYIPFWLFDVTANCKWHAQVAEGSGRNKRWIQESGEHVFFFNDLLLPGTRLLPPQLLAKAEPFNIEQMVEYKPDYLAGWPAATYDVSLAQASLDARERMVARAKKELWYKAAPGREIRDLQVAASDFAGMTYTQVLLPVWMGSYQYRGQRYRLLINGQTGRVAGSKPTDSVKVSLVILGAVIVLVLLGFVLAILFGPAAGQTP
jgi:DNA-directed RNA polymerase subunit RPC12/RpoP